MSIRDPAEQIFVRQVAAEQQQIIDASRRIMRGEIVGNLSELPVSSTWQGTPDQSVRYLVVVKMRDPATGERIDYPVEIYEDVPALKDYVTGKAIRMVQQREVSDKYKTKLDQYSTAVAFAAVIISASRGS